MQDKRKLWTGCAVLLFLLLLRPIPTTAQDSGEAELHRQAAELARKGDFPIALTLIERLRAARPGEIRYLFDHIVFLSWAERHPEALELFRTIETRPDIPVYVLYPTAVSARREKFYFLEMTLYQRILTKDPGHKPSREGYIMAVSSLGAPNLALEMMRHEKDLDLEPQLYEQLMGDVAAQRILWGQITPADDAERYRETDEALRLIDANILRLETYFRNHLDPQEQKLPLRVLWRARFDRLIGLRDRIRMKEIISDFWKMEREKIPLPAYARQQAADAFLYESQPRQARDLYAQIFREQPASHNTAVALFYGFLESEQYAAASRQIEAEAARQPEWFQLPGSRVYGDNENKLSADITRIMFQAYSRRMRTAQRDMEEKLDLAPYNYDLRLQLGKLYLWRGWPRRALHMFHLTLARLPGSIETAVQLHQAHIDFHRYDLARRGVQDLWARYPEKKDVQKLKRNWDTHHMWLFHSEMISANGQGRVLGNRDFMADNYLYTPPFMNGIKAFVHFYSHTARFSGDEARHHRWGFGLDFNRGATRGQIEVLRRLSGDPDYGWRLGGYWKLDDKWEVSGEYFHNSLDIPMKGRLADLKGDAASAGLVWRLSDLTHLKAAWLFSDYNDGNRRHAYLFLGRQRWYSGPGLTFDTQLEIYGSRANLADRYYFNPRSDFSWLLTLDAWQTIYRFYNFKFVHRLAASWGTYSQHLFDPGPLLIIRYEHHWDLDDRRAFLYGFIFSRRTYDGVPENAGTFYITINWRF